MMPIASEDDEAELVKLLRALLPDGWDETCVRAPLSTTDSSTQARLERISATVGDQCYCFVVKRLTRLGDWLARATDDRLIREHAINAAGIFTRLPPAVASATLASTTTRDGAIVIMRDLTDNLLPSGEQPLNGDQVRRIMRGLASMHSALAGFPADLAERGGLNRLSAWLTPLSHATARREATQPHRDPFTPLIDPGWAGYAQIAPESWDIIGPLLENPQPVVDALGQFPRTLVHGDVKTGNMALDGDTLVLFDWSTTTVGPGALDLAWFLCINAFRLPCSKADVIEIYRQERAAQGVLAAAGDAWERELALAMLTSPMRLGWLRGYLATARDSTRDREEVRFWAQQSLSARRFL